tara:strand:+ start:274 stop:996 length:723 start_codon:yes stop_codon:yes gene_type:complete
MNCLIYILFFNLIISQVHFSDLPEATGLSNIVIIENIIGLESGDEVGLFDPSGLLSYGDDCIDEYGELLVGAGVYNGSQMNIVGIGSLDACDFNEGYQLPGFIEGHPILIKVWDSSEDVEYIIPDVNFSSGSGYWGDLYSVIDTLVVNELSNISSNFSLYEIYPNPFNSIAIFNINHSINNPLYISIFDISGRLIEKITFYNPIYDQKIMWDASNYNSGTYIVNFESSNIILSKKISLIK